MEKFKISISCTEDGMKRKKTVALTADLVEDGGDIGYQLPLALCFVIEGLGIEVEVGKVLCEAISECHPKDESWGKEKKDRFCDLIFAARRWLELPYEHLVDGKVESKKRKKP